MRILFLIAHYYNSNGNKRYSSSSSNSSVRINALSLCLSSIHNLFGKNQYQLDMYQGKLLTLPKNQSNHVDIVICTTKDSHLISKLAIAPNLYTHCPVAVEPMLLGFECQRILKENLNNYDYYCFMEDDLIFNDPYFFKKLKWFNSKVDNICLLQPNRFEVSYTGNPVKMYVDGDLRPALISKYQNITENSRIFASVMENKIVFQKPLNPHSGCYFLNKIQMEYWANQPHFYDKDTSFVGPLESAATLGIIKTFKIYKPASSSADFLEIQHFGQKFIKIVTDGIAKRVSAIQN